MNVEFVNVMLIIVLVVSVCFNVLFLLNDDCECIVGACHPVVVDEVDVMGDVVVEEEEVVVVFNDVINEREMLFVNKTFLCYSFNGSGVCMNDSDENRNNLWSRGFRNSWIVDCGECVGVSECPICWTGEVLE